MVSLHFFVGTSAVLSLVVGVFVCFLVTTDAALSLNGGLMSVTVNHVAEDVHLASSGGVGFSVYARQNIGLYNLLLLLFNQRTTCENYIWLTLHVVGHSSFFAAVLALIGPVGIMLVVIDYELLLLLQLLPWQLMHQLVPLLHPWIVYAAV